MAGWSQNDGNKDNSSITQTISPSTTTSTQSGFSSGNETTSLFENKDLDILRNLIGTLQGQYLKQVTSKQQQSSNLEGLVTTLLQDYKKNSAFEDAKGLMALNIQQGLEKGTPAIARSIESAGTSASSMQALLAQKLATDSALNASALGAQQAGQYGNILANLLSILQKNSTDNQDTQTLQGLLGAMQLLRGARTSSSKVGSTNQQGEQKNSGYTMSAVRGDNNASPFTSVGGSSSSGNRLIDMAAANGYAGDLRDIASYSTSGQSISNYINSTNDLGDW